jgi:hypothetical protein
MVLFARMHTTEYHMIILMGDQVSFPKLARYVRYELPKVASIDVVANGFLRWAQMDRATLQRALTWDNQPTLMFRPMPTTIDRLVSGECSLGSLGSDAAAEQPLAISAISCPVSHTRHY